MTNLIYRGVTHQRQKATGIRVAQDLVYRGVRHDGHGTETRTPPRNIAMRYRGVAYMLEDGVARAPEMTAPDAAS